MKQSEKEITRAIRSVLKGLGIWHWKHFQGGMTPIKGISDILGCYKGRMLAIEVKTDVGRVSDDQQRFIKRVIEEGGIAFVARSVDDVINGLGVRDRFLF